MVHGTGTIVSRINDDTTQERHWGIGNGVHHPADRVYRDRQLHWGQGPADRSHRFHESRTKQDSVVVRVLRLLTRRTQHPSRLPDPFYFTPSHP